MTHQEGELLKVEAVFKVATLARRPALALDARGGAAFGEPDDLRAPHTWSCEHVSVALVWYLPTSLTAFREAMARDRWVLEWVGGEERSSISYDEVDFDYNETFAPPDRTEAVPLLLSHGPVEGNLYADRRYTWQGDETPLVYFGDELVIFDCSREQVLAEVERWFGS